LYAAGAVLNGPHIEVSFTDELAPGVWGLGGPATKLDAVTPASGNAFIPIGKSVLLLPTNLSTRPSSSEQFFLTAVHEFGHTLGLQHTWTSSVMSTEQTRSTSKAAPLGLDDMAGLSQLYPTKTYLATMGSITGRITMGGGGVHLASVVAMTGNGQAVSTLSSPDGTFRLDGLSAGNYMVYAQPLPPYPAGGAVQPADLILPEDPSGAKMLPTGYFDPAFYPGTAKPEQTVAVYNGRVTDSVNISVKARAGVSLYDVATYSYAYSVAGTPSVKPATLLAANGTSRTVMSAAGFPASGAGLTVSLLGMPEAVSNIYPYTAQFLILDFPMTTVSLDGPRHILYSYNGQSYVQPAAVRVVSKRQPIISSIVANADRTLTVNGSGFVTKSAVQVDGVAAKLVSQSDTQLVVAPPPAPAGYKGAVAVFNPDGQSSLFYATVAPPVYTYDTPETVRVTPSVTSLAAGSETLVELTGSGTDFLSWVPTFAVGSGDVIVKQIWALTPTKAIAQVVATPTAVAGPATLVTGSGLTMTATSGGFQILPASHAPYFATSQLPKGAFYEGSAMWVPVVNAPVAGTLAATITDRTGTERRALVLSYLNGQALIATPAGLELGGAILRGTVDGQAVTPAAIQIDPVPPVILQMLGESAQPGATVALVVANLMTNGSSVATSRLKVSGAGLQHAVLSTSPNAAVPGTVIVQFELSKATPAGPVSIMLSLDDVPSQPFAVTVGPGVGSEL